MIILDEPYVSEFLKESVIKLDLPVLDNIVARSLSFGNDFAPCPEDDFVCRLSEFSHPRLYTNSENAGDWIAAKLDDTDLPRQVHAFKNKVEFRKLLQDMYPGFHFLSSSVDELEHLDISSLSFPFIIKPAVGFFSLGVHVVDGPEKWPEVVAAVKREAAAVKNMYPQQVLDTGRFILEERIQGPEYAVDVYYNDAGEPVILNILGHLFGSEHDVSDRVYITSGTIIREHLEAFTAVLHTIGRKAGLRNFPAHAELRIDPNHGIIPIEINPMRFAGWCCTDVAHFAYGINPYACYFHDSAPNWDSILQAREGKAYAIIVADLPAELDRSRIESVDYDAFTAHFSNPLEIRPVDYSRYSVFAFAFVQVPEDDTAELESILQDDLLRFLRFR